MADTAIQDPSDVHLIVHTVAAGALGTELACVHVFPPSSVLRKVPTGSLDVPCPESAAAAFPPTLSTQCAASPQANLPGYAPGIPVGIGTRETLQLWPPSVVMANVASTSELELVGCPITAHVPASTQENENC